MIYEQLCIPQLTAHNSVGQMQHIIIIIRRKSGNTVGRILQSDIVEQSEHNSFVTLCSDLRFFLQTFFDSIQSSSRVVAQWNCGLKSDDLHSTPLDAIVHDASSKREQLHKSYHKIVTTFIYERGMLNCHRIYICQCSFLFTLQTLGEIVVMAQRGENRGILNLHRS